jgi:hypothetical protein
MISNSILVVNIGDTVAWNCGWIPSSMRTDHPETPKCGADGNARGPEALADTVAELGPRASEPVDDLNVAL